MKEKETAKMVRKVVKKVSHNQLISDLKKYRNEAITLGASDAKIIKSEEVLIDERAYAKCMYPKCQAYGTNANCPPYSMKPEELRKVVKKYKYGIILTFEAPSSAFVGSYARLTQKGESAAYRRKMHEIVSKLEAMAFYDGYYFALGFAGGPCKSVFCKDLECQALQPGKACRFPLKARSAMEGVGMDVFGMVTRMGWDVYPCGSSLSSKDVPLGRRVGIVFIY
jgi:predicted metal-binding protein